MRTDIEFDSNGTTVRGWHYQPVVDDLAGPAGAPAIILAPGMSFTRDSGFEPFAERFAAAGMHAIVFDYRTFGDSDGTPREVISVRWQIADYLAATAAARAIEGIDPARIALWGFSYAGGVVVDAAVQDGRVAAVVSQAPNLDNLATLRFQARRNTMRRRAWIVYAVTRDVIAAILRRPPYYVVGQGRPGERAMYLSDESVDLTAQIKGPSWKNRFAPRDFASLPPFRPIRRIKKLPCRIQLLTCEIDDLTPSAPVLKAAELAGDRAELHRYQVSHFGLMVGENFEDAVAKQCDFLRRELAPVRPAPAD